MRIEYENNYLDLLAFNVIHQFLSPVLQGFFLLVSGMPFYFGSDPELQVPAWFMSLFYYVLLWIIQIPFNALYLFSRKNHGVLTRHTLEIDDAALVEETIFNKSFFYWRGIVRAISRPGFVAIYVTPHMAHIVPNRAFSSTAERESFLASVRKRIQSATS